MASRSVIDGTVTVGSLWVFVTYMQAIYQLMNQVMFVFGPFQDAVVGVGRAFQVLDTEPDITERPGAVALAPFQRELRLDGASLVHDGGQVALDGVDIVVRRGEKVALVGETGSGKTSVLNLLPRLYDVTAGRVTVDGVDVRDVTLASLRHQISVVSQEPLLFSASIRDNIRYGRVGATDAEVEAAAAAARAHDFIVALPDGYATDVGERGVKLSLGQQQRISIARAFLKDAPILLLDEPTSALDATTEADFLTSLEALMSGRTVVIVAHRLSTIRGADRIYVLDHGRVVECGAPGRPPRPRRRLPPPPRPPAAPSRREVGLDDRHPGLTQHLGQLAALGRGDGVELEPAGHQPQLVEQRLHHGAERRRPPRRRRPAPAARRRPDRPSGRRGRRGGRRAGTAACSSRRSASAPACRSRSGRRSRTAARCAGGTTRASRTG